MLSTLVGMQWLSRAKRKNYSHAVVRVGCLEKMIESLCNRVRGIHEVEGERKVFRG